MTIYSKISQFKTKNCVLQVQVDVSLEIQKYVLKYCFYMIWGQEMTTPYHLRKAGFPLWQVTFRTISFHCKRIYSKAFLPVVFIQHWFIWDVRRMFIWASLVKILINIVMYLYLPFECHPFTFLCQYILNFISLKSLTKKMYNGLEIE